MMREENWSMGKMKRVCNSRCPLGTVNKRYTAPCVSVASDKLRQEIYTYFKKSSEHNMCNVAYAAKERYNELVRAIEKQGYKYDGNKIIYMGK